METSYMQEYYQSKRQEVIDSLIRQNEYKKMLERLNSGNHKVSRDIKRTFSVNEIASNLQSYLKNKRESQKIR